MLFTSKRPSCLLILIVCWSAASIRAYSQEPAPAYQVAPTAADPKQPVAQPAEQPAEQAAEQATEQPDKAAAQIAVAEVVAGEVVADKVDIVAADELEEKLFIENVQFAGDPQLWLLRAYAQVECALARRACELSMEEEQQLTQLDDAWIAKQINKELQSPIKDVAAGVAGLLQRAWLLRAAARQPGRGRNEQHEITARVKLAIDEFVADSLSTEHRAAYLQQRAARDQFRNQALAAVLVSILDERLFLTREQREKLEPEIAKWLTKELYWEFYFQNPNYVPDIPRAVLQRCITKAQLDSLQGLQKWNYEKSQVELQLMQAAPEVIER